MSDTTIWCPDWCRFTKEEHQGELDAGRIALDHKSDRNGGEPFLSDAVLLCTALPNGTPVKEDESHADVMLLEHDGTLTHPDEITEHANAIRDLADLMRTAISWRVCPWWCDGTGTDSHTADGAMDWVGPRKTLVHHGSPFGRFFTVHLEFFADSGEERSWAAFLDLPQDAELDAHDVGLLSSQAANIAAWLAGEVEA